MEASTQIKEIMNSAKLAYDKSCNAPDLVPYGKEIIDLINNDQGDQSQYIFIFKQAWEQCWGPFELIAFCMHTLRWPELKNYFDSLYKQSVATEDWRAEPCLREIVEAFESNWENAIDFYGAYFEQKT